jgi:peptide/nickel transport system ATP-binding protein
MYAGKIVEKGNIRDILKSPRHPYSMGLSNAFPDLLKNDKLISINGSVPNLALEQKGCRFVSRCPFSVDLCHTQEPELTEYEEGSYAACHRVQDYIELQEQAKGVSVWEKVTS